MNSNQNCFWFKELVDIDNMAPLRIQFVGNNRNFGYLFDGKWLKLTNQQCHFLDIWPKYTEFEVLVLNNWNKRFI